MFYGSGPWPKICNWCKSLHNCNTLSFSRKYYIGLHVIIYPDCQLQMKKFYNIRRRFDMLKCRLASAVKNGLDYVTILVSVFLLVSKYQTFFFAIWQKRPKEIKHFQASLANKATCDSVSPYLQILEQVGITCKEQAL